MCAHYNFSSSDDLREYYDLGNGIELKESYDMYPSYDGPVVTVEGKLEIYKWGLIPFWAKDASIGRKMFNARAETLDEKSSFKKILSQRCLIPGTSFYEYKKLEDGKKIPTLVRLKDREIFSFAGLYSMWKNPDGKLIGTYTMITTEPNEFMSKIHNRMPVILKREEEKEYLNPDLTEYGQIQEFLKPYEGQMEANPLGK